MRLLALVLLCFTAVVANAQDGDRPFWPSEMKKIHITLQGIKSRLGFVSCIQDGHPSKYELDCDAKHTALQKQVDEMLARIEEVARPGAYAGESAYQSALKDTEAAAQLLEEDCEKLLLELESEE
ncbi:hypothetical protein JNK62_03545 [bacterium]|nr:hypothetical protein [bacterium]